MTHDLPPGQSSCWGLVRGRAAVAGPCSGGSRELWGTLTVSFTSGRSVFVGAELLWTWGAWRRKEKTGAGNHVSYLIDLEKNGDVKSAFGGGGREGERKSNT